MTVTKATIADLIQGQFGFSKNKSVDLVEALLEILKKNLESGDDVMVSGFGKFCVKEKKVRKGRNPSTGAEMMLDARKVVTFQCSKKLREKISSGE